MRPRVYASPAERAAAYRRRKRDAKNATFDPGQRGARVIRSGALTVARPPDGDGRALLWLHTKRGGGAWLELLPRDVVWLVATLQNCGGEVV